MTYNFRLARKNKGFTQEEVAERLGITQKSISSWETGVREPDITNLIRLSDIYEVTVDYLIGHVESNKDKCQAKTSSEICLLRDFRELNEDGQNYIKQQMFVALSIYKNDHKLPDLESEKIG